MTLRIAHFSDPDSFVEATKLHDDSFLNFALGALMDSMDEGQAQSQARWGPKLRILLAIYREDDLIITFTKIAQDFSWVISTIRDVEIAAEEVAVAIDLLANFIPTIVDPQTVDKLIGPVNLVDAFIEHWVVFMASRGVQLKTPDPYFTSRVSYCTLATLPGPSPAFAHYAISQSTEDDIEALVPLYITFSQEGPMPATVDQARSFMGDGVHVRRIWQCRVGHAVAGYVLVGRVTPRTSAIRNVFVTPDYRQKGIAEAMVKAVTRFYLGAKPLGFEGAPESGPIGGTKEEVCLNVADEGAARLYKRCGFLLDDGAKDPVSGKQSWYATVWRGVEPALTP